MLKCTFEDGNEATQGLRHVVVDTLVLDGTKILLIKRTGKLLEGGKWGLVGGFVDRDENLHEAVVREVMEETGFTVKNISLFRIKDNPNRPSEDRQNVSFVFTCEAVEKIGESDWEVDDQKWFELSEVPEKEMIAFDHAEDIQLYMKHIKEKHRVALLSGPN